MPSSDKFVIRKRPAEAWLMAGGTLALAGYFTFSSSLGEPPQPAFTVFVWTVALYELFRAVQSPELVTVTSKGIMYHGWLSDTFVRWSDVEAVEVDSFWTVKGFLYRRIIFFCSNTTLEFSNTFAPSLVADVVAHLKTRPETQKLLADVKLKGGGDVPLEFFDPRGGRFATWILPFIGGMFVLGGAGAVYLGSFYAGVLGVWLGLFIIHFYPFNRSG